MYDKGKIITGVVIGLLLVTFPLTYLVASGEGGYVPEPVLPPDEEQCVEPADWMRDNHMRLLDEWRNTAVRGGDRIHGSSGGTEYYIGLTGLDEEEMSVVRDSLGMTDLKSGGCLQCHSNKDEFCDTCHSYVGAEPECWNCHVEEED